VQLIMERPDVQASIAAVMRAAGQVGISEAELYPRIGVEGAVYYSGTIVKNGSTVKDGMLSFLVPNLRFPIYDWGMAREQKNASEAELRRTILGYRETVLQAIADTEMAIANFNAMNERMQRSAEEAQNLAQAAERNKSGLQAGYLSPLDAFNGNIKLLERKLANIDDQSLWLTAFAGANKAQTSMKLEKANIQSSQVEATK
jgi:outer membrane protein TolC